MNWLYAPLWSPRVIAIAVVALLLLAVLRWRREKRGGGLMVVRSAIVLLLLLVLLNPQALLPRDRDGKPKLVVLLDVSGSMAVEDAGGGSRFAAAMERLADPRVRDALESEFEVDLRLFDRETRPADWSELEGGREFGDGSEIATAILSVVGEIGGQREQAGVLLISDGRATSAGVVEAGQYALARSAPVWSWTLGGEVARRDVWIETVSSEALAFSGAEVELAATLRVEGYSNRSFAVEILRGETVVESRELTPGEGGSARITARVVASEAGEHRYVFRAAPQAEEADTANNERSVFLRSVGERARVLIAEGQPHWETKFLVQTLKRNPHVDLTAVYRLSATRHLAVVSSTGSETRVDADLFPRTEEAMNAFDVIILGRGADAFFDGNTERLLTDYVARRGGSVVFARGRPYGGRFQPLAKFEPLAWGEGAAGEVRINVTEAGRETPIFDLGASSDIDEVLDRLPALDQASATLGEKPLAVVLASGSDGVGGPAILAYQRYGQGKALSLNASGMWRWSFRESGQEEAEVAYERFWVSLLQWLLSSGRFLPGADAALSASRRYYTSEQPVQLLVSTRNLDPAAYQPRIVISGGGREVAIEPRLRGEVYVAEAGPFPPGSYQAVLRNNIGSPGEISQTIEVVDASVEKRNVSADPELMRRLAEVSGGSVILAGDVARLPELVRRWEASRELAHRQRPVWDRWWLLAGMIAMLGGEWWLRRREGLV